MHKCGRMRAWCLSPRARSTSTCSVRTAGSGASGLHGSSSSNNSSLRYQLLIRQSPVPTLLAQIHSSRAGLPLARERLALQTDLADGRVRQLRTRHPNSSAIHRMRRPKRITLSPYTRTILAHPAHTRASVQTTPVHRSRVTTHRASTRTHSPIR